MAIPICCFCDPIFAIGACVNITISKLKENSMNQPIYDSILARRSVRDFLAKPVEPEKIDKLLKAAMAAPSACNLQPWTFIVIDDPKILEQVKASTTQGQYNAPLAVAICGVYHHIPWEGGGWSVDCGMAAQNMMLQAVELGLGSVCIASYDEDKLREILSIPEDIQPLVLIEFGYPARVPVSHTWYTDEAVHRNGFDSKKSRAFRTIEMLREDSEAGLM